VARWWVVTDSSSAKRARSLALARGGVTDSSGIATSIEWASNRVVSNANTSPAAVSLGARISVIASSSIGLDWIRAKSSLRVANTSIVALVRSGTNNRADTRANTCIASIVGGTQVVVIARSSVGFDWVGALSSSRVANTSIMALVLSRASNWSSLADTAAAVIIVGTIIIVIARLGVV